MVCSSGIGFCISALPAPVIVQHHFSHNRALASGLAMLGFSIGNIVGPRITEQLLEAYGWKGTLLIMAGLMANRAPIGLTFWPPKKIRTSYKQNSDSENKSEKSCRSTVTDVVDFSLFKNKAFSLFCLGSMMEMFYITAFINHLPSYAVHKGHSLEQAAFLSSLIFISNTSVRLVVSFVSNLKCVNKVVQYAMGCLVGSGAIMIMLLADSYYGIMAATILTGAHLGKSTHIICM